MKKISTFIFALLLSSVFAFADFTAVSAYNSAVYFEGGAEDFLVYPDHDLFDGFKNVYPGDTLTEEIRVRNSAPEYDYVKIYLRAEPHDDVNNRPLTGVDTVAMQDFLAQLSMKVYNGDKLIYDAYPDQLAGLAKNQLLGKFANGEKTNLTVKLEVPAMLDNKYMHRVGEVDWIFTAEGYKEDKPVCPDYPTCSECPECPSCPDDKPQELPKPPKTGDNLELDIYAFIISAIGLTGSLILKAKA